MTRSMGIDRVDDTSENRLQVVGAGEANWTSQINVNEDSPFELPPKVTAENLLDSNPPLTESISGLAKVVSELKEQLKQSARVNSVLESDVRTANAQLAKTNEECESLHYKIHEMQEENSSMEDLRDELKQMSRERDTLASKVHDLGQMLTISERRLHEISQLLDRFRAERNDAVQEASCLDSQFGRAMKVIEELRSTISKGQQREAEFEERVSALEQGLDNAIAERDSYLNELNESLRTLQEVRQSILATSVS